MANRMKCHPHGSVLFCTSSIEEGLHNRWFGAISCEQAAPGYRELCMGMLYRGTGEESNA
jgi:hypothetical protein